MYEHVRGDKSKEMKERTKKNVIKKYVNAHASQSMTYILNILPFFQKENWKIYVEHNLMLEMYQYTAL